MITNRTVNQYYVICDICGSHSRYADTKEQARILAHEECFVVDEFFSGAYLVSHDYCHDCWQLKNMSAAELLIAQDCSVDEEADNYNPYLLSGEELDRAVNAACEL